MANVPLTEREKTMERDTVAAKEKMRAAQAEERRIAADLKAANEKLAGMAALEDRAELAEEKCKSLEGQLRSANEAVASMRKQMDKDAELVAAARAMAEAMQTLSAKAK